jgi:polyhydroxybutyrate depolymerase
MKLLRPTGVALSFSLMALGGCSDAESDGPDGPRFTGAGAPVNATPGNTAGTGAPGNGAPAPSNGAPSSPSPTPAGNEQPPVAGGIDTSGAAPAGMVGGTPAPGASGTPAAEQPGAQTPVPATAEASAGCGLSPGIPQNVAIDSTIMTFPPDYDGSTPVPIVFAFHGANRTNLQQQMEDSRTVDSELERNYVMAFVKSAGTAWNLATDYPRFQAIRSQILAQFCIDTEHVFAFGHSSGAQFIAQMLGSPSTRETGFAAIAPVSSSLFPNPAWSPVPTLLIHGLNDTQRPNDLNGAQDISQYAASNQCSGSTTPLAVSTCNSIANNTAVNPGCVQYDGCAAPTLFCNHNDPNYLDNGTPTNHGWPCFANAEIFQFFESQR